MNALEFRRILFILLCSSRKVFEGRVRLGRLSPRTPFAVAANCLFHARAFDDGGSGYHYTVALSACGSRWVFAGRDAMRARTVLMRKDNFSHLYTFLSTFTGSGICICPIRFPRC